MRTNNAVTAEDIDTDLTLAVIGDKPGSKNYNWFWSTFSKIVLNNIVNYFTRLHTTNNKNNWWIKIHSLGWLWPYKWSLDLY